MIYFSLYEILRMTLSMFIFGAFFVCFEIATDTIFTSLADIFHLFKSQFSQNTIFSIYRIKFKAESKNKLQLFFCDLIKTTSFFVIFILLSYAFYDGIVRIWFLLLALLSRFISKNTLGKVMKTLIEKILTVFFFVFSAVLSFLMIPVKILLKLFRFISLPIVKKAKIKRSRRYFDKKIKEIGTFFAKSMKN